jgi:23S rRNA pseudouridine2605 synthase
MQVRLQKLLSQWGVASRRHAEALILAGRVTVNDQPAHLGQKADPVADRVQLDGRLLGQQEPERCYLLLHKPRGVVSTCQDPQGRTTVLDLLPPPLRQNQGIHPVGRLDADSTGALLLTNDGRLTQRVTHPRYPMPKRYQVTLQGRPTPEQLEQWRRGLMLDGKLTLPAAVRLLKSRDPAQTLLDITLREGRNRQIRRIAKNLGYSVINLHRYAIGSIYLKQLAPGSYRPLSTHELKALLSASARCRDAPAG